MRPFIDQNDRYSYEYWMNEMGADEGLPELPPMGHPLQKLGARLGELLDEDQFAECEALLLAAGVMPEANESLRAELSAYREDAERYRWLRNRIPGSAYRIAGIIYSEGGVGVDAAIDAARKGEGE